MTAVNFDFFAPLRQRKWKGTSEDIVANVVNAAVTAMPDALPDGVSQQLLALVKQSCRGQPDFTESFAQYISSLDKSFNVSDSDNSGFKRISTQLALSASRNIPNISSGKIQIDDPWMPYAEGGLLAVCFNTFFVPVLRKEHIATDCKAKNISKICFRKRYSAKVYEGEKNIVIIGDWQERCCKLTSPIVTPANVPQLFSLIQEAIVLYWCSPSGEEDYAKILKMTMRWKTSTTDGRRRHFALRQIRQKLVSIANQWPKTESPVG